ncbi:TraB/GumN family protein [Chelativorans sp. AA-79]|uniref:TraB/GumN family protein n=1 Tax=Chelativorans sp. AA-79 TaxID=3028735 RepID=UPI0023F994BB|nr:TraB/GumN family protein [Chelativorans sp. AA-79]WEX09902.1 TraB/GumN family protein [Chelativorans sp. AA-79]
MKNDRLAPGHPARPLLTTLAAALLLLFLAALPAAGRAAEEAACTGTDLVAELGRENPALLRRIETEAEAIPNGEGLLWRVEGRATAPSYLFGTMHVTDPRVTKLPEAAQNAFAEARKVVIETTDILDRQAMMAAMLEKPGLMMFPEGESLTDHLTPEQRQTVEEALQKRGMPLQSVIRMKPWILISLVSLPECELQRQQKGTPVLDAKLAQEAEAAGKDVTGLETVTEQLSAMASLPLDLHIQGLVGTLDLGERMDDVIETMVALYIKGETGMFRPALGELLELEGQEEADYAAFEERMVKMRNRVMAERAVPLLEEGGAFIAVGAMHLPGETGLIELLRDAGYRVSRAE